MSRTSIQIGSLKASHDSAPVFTIHAEDQTVVAVDIDLCSNHRGVEKISEAKSYDQAAFLAERICGSCSVAHSLAYSNSVEDILGIEPPERALYIRTVMAEFERINSCLLWLGLMGHLLASKVLFMSSWRYREPILDLLETIAGSRCHPGIVKPGGVRQDIEAVHAPQILKALSDLNSAADSLRGIILDNLLIQERTKGIGVIKTEQALAYAAVGPVARASAVEVDARKNNPYAAYGNIKWHTAVEEEGDVFARIKVRIKELYESINIIKQCLKKMHKGIIDTRIKEIPAGEGIGTAEAPDGETVHYVRSDGSNSPARHKIRPASFMNMPLAEASLIGQDLADAGIILASLDPCYCCAGRMAVMDKT